MYKRTVRQFGHLPEVISRCRVSKIQGGSNMTGTDLCLRLYKSVPVIFEPPCINKNYCGLLSWYYCLSKLSKIWISQPLLEDCLILEASPFSSEWHSGCLWRAGHWRRMDAMLWVATCDDSTERQSVSCSRSSEGLDWEDREVFVRLTPWRENGQTTKSRRIPHVTVRSGEQAHRVVSGNGSIVNGEGGEQCPETFLVRLREQN